MDAVSHFKTFKLKDYLKTPGYDESIFCAEDKDISYKMEEVTRLKFVDKCLYIYRELPHSVSHDARNGAVRRESVARAKSNALTRRFLKAKKENPANYYQAAGNPLVSVWMAAYNAADSIARAIESVLIQNYRNIELIVVDDGSTDRTADIVRGINNDAIKYLFKEHGGLASARNLQLEKTCGSFIVPLDSDDVMMPDFIARHLQVFERHPEADLVYCDDMLIDDQCRPIRVINRPQFPDPKMLIPNLFRYGFPIVPFRTCIRRSVFDKIGLYDERLVVAEDYDMMRRFVKQGLNVCYLPAALYLRRVGAGSHSRNFDAAKAKSQFEAIRRFTETFTPEQLFPELRWEILSVEQRQLLAKFKTATAFIAIGRQYQNCGASDYVAEAIDQAYAQLGECLKVEPENRQLGHLWRKCRAIRARQLQLARRPAYQST
jgi:glycosyltransferase involved in cell wall biosynthesis